MLHLPQTGVLCITRNVQLIGTQTNLTSHLVTNLITHSPEASSLCPFVMKPLWNLFFHPHYVMIIRPCVRVRQVGQVGSQGGERRRREDFVEPSPAVQYIQTFIKHHWLTKP